MPSSRSFFNWSGRSHTLEHHYEQFEPSTGQPTLYSIIFTNCAGKREFFNLMPDLFACTGCLQTFDVHLIPSKE